MKHSIKSQWRKFEAWKKRFAESANLFIAKDFKRGYSDEASALFLCTFAECQYGLDDPLCFNSIDRKQLRQRVQDKVSFLGSYLANTFLDDGEDHLAFLSLQYPKRCHKAMAVWFEQQSIEEPRLRGSCGFEVFESVVFLDKISQINFSDVHNVLSYDHIHFKTKAGDAWTNKSAYEAVKHIENELKHDGFTFKLAHKVHDANMMSLYFEWK